MAQVHRIVPRNLVLVGLSRYFYSFVLSLKYVNQFSLATPGSSFSTLNGLNLIVKFVNHLPIPTVIVREAKVENFVLGFVRHV